ncbi:MAG: hypothetical protein R8G01_15955 [Ilumatobacteraceae bacterium]|nr:hypothetical protein [Ilumatobacteraceae bacterium]
MSTLAHVLEAAGLATIVLASMWEVVERMAPPRALYCNFPLGRPLGHPADAEFQHDVLRRAFDLLAADGPVLEAHPVVIEADETPMACTIPPRFDPTLPPAVDEANGLRAAYERARARRGVTSVGRVIDADTVPEALAVLHEWAGGADWNEHPVPGTNTTAVCHDIRTYYEEAALELVTGPPPGGRAAEAWFFETTEAGATVLAARRAIKAQGAPHPVWFYMAPGHR